MPGRPLVIAHAACKGHAPENTLAGVRAALALGVDAIEVDVHCTADGVPVLIHDATVDRTTDGSGAVAALTLAELRRLDAGVRAFNGRFAGEHIPTLAEALDLTRGHCLLVVEVKAPGIEREVLSVLRPAADDVMVWSFFPEVVTRVRELAPAVPCALLSPTLEGRPPEELLRTALQAHQQAVAVHHSSVDQELVRRAARRGLSVFAWTADEPAEQRRLLAAGVAGIVTNYPDRLHAALSGHTASPR